MGMLRFAAVVGASVALTGCSDDYDGTYAGGTGFMSVAAMILDGYTAKVETVPLLFETPRFGLQSRCNL